MLRHDETGNVLDEGTHREIIMMLKSIVVIHMMVEQAIYQCMKWRRMTEGGHAEAK